MAPHLSRPALIRLLSGEAVQTEVDGMVPHLVACRPCWELAAGVVAELKKEKVLAHSTDARSAVLTLLEVEERAARDLLRARGWWAELKAMSPEEQIDRIRSVAAMRTPALFEVVLAEARAVAPGDPFLGEQTADLRAVRGPPHGVERGVSGSPPAGLSGCIRGSEKSFREVIGGYLEEELYKDAFLTLLTFFEILFKRGALRKAKQVYKQAADVLAQAGSGSHEQMRQVWRHLLQQMERESLKEYQLQEVRQYVYRHWNTPAPRPPFAAPCGYFTTSQRPPLVGPT